MILFLAGKVYTVYKNSAVYRVLAVIYAFFGRLSSNSFFKHVLTGENPGAESVLRTSVFGRIDGAVSAFSRQKEGTERDNGLVLGYLGRVLSDLPVTSVRSFGCLLLGFGVWFLFADRPWFYLLIAIAALGIVLFIVDRSLWNLFGTSVLVKFAAGFFGFDGEICKEHRPEQDYRVFYLLLGFVTGAMFTFMSFGVFVMTAGAVIGSVLILYKTEVGIFAAALLIPIAPTMLVSGVAAITVLSYFIKIFIVRKGELPFNIGALDVCALLFALSLAYSVVIAYHRSSALFVASAYILYILFFIVTKNTLRTKRMIVAAISILAISGLFVAAFGIWQRVTGNFVETAAWIDGEMFVGVTSRIYSTLENPNVLGKYLIFALLLAFGMLYYLKNPLHKMGVLGILGIAGLCMVFTQSRGAWLGLLLAFALFALMHDKRLVILGIVGLLLMPVFLPDAILNRFLSIGDIGDTSTHFRVNIWLGTLAMLRMVWPSGIGLGTENFKFVYQEFAFTAVEAPHSHNLFMQIIVDQGIFGLLLFLLLIAVFFRYLFTRHRQLKDRAIRAITAALAAGMFGYLVQGMTDNVFYNYRVVTYFWFILAIAGAIHGLALTKGELSNGKTPKTQIKA